MANYHVNYLTGSDVTGDGSTSTPWASVNHALVTSSATTGDVIKVVGSTTTDLDTTATFATNDRTQNLTTTTDLTGSLSVGDIIIISPNLSDGAEFNGWMHTEVQAITATTLTTRGYHVYPNQTSLSVTITKVNDPVLSNTQESIANTENYAGAEIIFGYDATFTSVIGLTYFVNNVVSVGGRSGTKFNLSGAQSTGGWDQYMPLFKNAAFCRFENAIQVNTFHVAYVNNIHLLNAQGAGFGGANAGFRGPVADGSTDVYFNDCDGSFLSVNYTTYAFNNSASTQLQGAPVNLWLNQNRDRQLENNTGLIQNVIGYAVKGRQFGFAALFNVSQNMYITGDVVLMGLDDVAYQADYYKCPTITQGSCNLYLNSFKLVKNGLAAVNMAFNLVMMNLENITQGNSYIKLPTGVSLDDYQMVGYDAGSVGNSSQTYEDVDGLWTGTGGCVFFKQNLVDQETGASCLELLQTGGQTYAGSKNSPYICSFPTSSGAQRLTGISFRYKQLPGSGTKSGYLVRTPIGQNFENMSVGSINLNSTNWATSTVTFGGPGSRLVNSLPTGVYVSFMLGVNGQADDGHHVLIDSITPNYS